MAGIVASAGAKQIQSGLLSPLQLPGLQLWLDGADPLGSGIAPANTTLSTWIDKSGNGRNATGFGGSPPYVSANRSVSLNGSQYYTIPYAGTHSTESIFFVLTCTNVSSDQILLVGDVTGTRQIIQRAPQIGVRDVSNNASCGNPSLNTLSMLEFTFNSSDTFAYLNGTPGSRGDGMNPGYESFLYLGRSLNIATFFTGTISEILIYNQFLSTYQRQAIEGYLAWKWNIISSLPANHPYRNFAASPSIISTNFFPTYFPGIQLWLDGNDPAGTGIIPANGTNVTTWADKSGNGFNATTAAGTLTYSNGVSSGVVFTGTQFMTTALNSLAPSESAFVVLKFNNITDQQDILSWNYGGGAARGREYMLYISQLAFDSTNGVIYYSTPPSAGVTFLGEYTYTTSVLNMYLNSSNTLSNTSISFTPGSQGTTIGSYNGGGYLNGTVNEIVVYNSVLTTSQRQVVEGYLAWKWNIQTSLLSNHPFRYSAPNSLSISGMTNYSYSPSYLPGLTAWYDAADPLGTGFQPANGTVISTWVDKTSESLNPMIATGSPTYTTGSQNGLPGITISGNPSYFMNHYFQAYVPSGTFLAELNAFVVYKNTSPVVYNTVITRSSTAAQYNAPLDMYNSRFYAGIFPTSYTELNSSFDLYNTTTSILNVTLTQSTQASSRFTAYRNGTGATLTLTGGSNVWIPSDTGTHLYLGTRGDKYTGFNGIFYEAMVFNYPLTPSGRQYVEGYLAWKWGLQNSLPTTHPYYAAAPSITSLFFQPSQIFGLNLWLDGADPLNTGILPANGATISTWFDKSPNAFPVTSVGSPTYALATRNITMNGTNQGFSFSYPGVHPTETGFFVVNMTTPDSYAFFINSPSSSGRQFYDYNTKLYLGQTYIGGVGATTTSTLTANSNTLLGYSLNSSNSFFYFNGTAGPTGTGFNNLPSESTLYIGYSGEGQFLGGTLSEVILFNTVLTITERQVVEGYLAWKWGIQASLQPQHPYKNFQPSLLTFAPSFTNTSMIPVNFQPTQISGLNLWLDGADPLNTGILPANGATISTWFDKSPNAFLASSIASPTYNLTTRTITLNGTSQYFTVPYGGSHPIETGFFVVNVTTPSQTYPVQYFLLGNSGNGARNFIVYDNNIQIQRLNLQNLGYTTTNNVPAGSFGLYGYTYNSNAGFAYLNGVVGSYSEGWTQEPTSDTGSFIGNSLASSFAEVIVFKRVLSVAERQVVEGYLAWKWGIQASLQAQHPYKNFQPSLLTFPPSFINTSTSAVNFQPTQISGLNLWLDGADPLNTSVAPANGTIISTWADKSGNARNATSVGSPVFNTSSNAIVLNGSSQAFTFSYPGVHPTETGFFVVNMTTPNSYAFFINSPSSSGRQLYDYFTQLYLGQTYIGGVGATTPSTLTASSNTLLGYTLNSSNSFVYFNGTAGPTGTGFSGLPSESTLYIGYSGEGQFVGGTISEILIYDKVLTSSERQQVEGYLAWKWGTQVSLPLAHPYKNIQPSNKNTLAIIANADAFLPLQSNTIDYAKTEQIVGSNGTLSFSNVLGKNCIYINGSTSNYISLPIANPPVFTFAFWFNYTNTQYFTVASYTTPLGAFAMQFDLVSAGSNTVYTALPNQWTNAPSSSNLGVNTWNFIAVTVNQSTYVENVYMNGVFASTATGTGAFPNSPSLMVLGKSGDGTVFPSGGNRSYQGYLQNFMYFNTILTGAQINAIYNQTAIDLARASQPTSLSLSFANPTLSLSWTAGLNTTSYVVNFYGVSANTNVGGILLTTVTTTSTSTTFNPGTFTYYYATVIPTNSGFLGTIATSSQVARPIPAQPTSLSLTFIDPIFYFSWTAGANTTSYSVTFYGNSTNANSGGTLLATFTQTATNKSYTPSNIMSYSYYYATVTPINSGESGTIATTSALRVLDLGIINRGSYNNSTGYVVNDLILNNDAAQSSAGGGILDNKYYIRVPPNMGALTGFPPGSAGAGTTTGNGYGGWWRLYIPGIGVPSLSYSNYTLTFSWGADANTSYTVSFYGVSTLTNIGGVLLTTITTSSKPVTYNPATYTYYYASVQPFITGINGVTISSLPVARPIPAQPTSLVLRFIDPKLYLSWTAGANTTSYSVTFYGNSTNSNSGGTLLATFNPSVTNQEYTPSNIMSYSYYYATVTPINSGDSGTMATTSALRVLDLGINYRGSYNNSTGYVVNDLILNNDAAQSSAGGGILDNKYYIRVPPNMGALTGFPPGSAGAGTTTGNGYGGWWRLYIPGIGVPSLSYSNYTLTFSWGADANTSYTVSFYGVSTLTNIGGVLLTTITTSSKPVTYNPATYTYYYASVQPFITGINGVTISSLPVART